MSILEILLSLLTSLSLLVTSALLLGMLKPFLRPLTERRRDLVQGCVFGLCAIVVMLNPIRVVDGVFFDLSNVIIVVAGALFGGVPASVICIFVLGYRFLLGGVELPLAIGSTLTGAVLGIGFHLYKKQHKLPLSRALIGLGLATALEMLFWLFLLPIETVRQVISVIALPIFLVYPVTSWIFGSLLISQGHHSDIEDSLNAERNMLRTLIDHVPDYIFVKDSTRRYLLSNLAHARAAGVSAPDDLIGKTASAFFPLNYGLQHDQDDEAVLRGESILAQERQTVNDSGGRIWVSTTKVPLRDTHGNIIGIVCISRDITAHKQAEEALQQERNLLRALIDAVPANVYIKDKDSRFIAANLETALQLGVKSANDLIGKTDFEFFGAELAGKYLANEQAIIQSGQALRNIEEPSFDHRTQQENLLLTTEVPMLDENGQVTGLVGVSLDITERKRIEKELEDERTLLHTLINAMPDYIYIKDRESRFVIGNTATALSLGAANAEEIVGKTDFDFHSPDLAARFFEDEQALFQSGKPLLNQEEIVIDRRTGKWQHLLSTNMPLYDRQGQITGLVGVNRDITERKHAEQALRESEERYRTVTELISDYAFSMRVEPDGTLVDEWVTADSFIRLTGYRSEEIGTRYILYHPDDVEAVQQHIQAVIQGQSTSQECRIITKDGTTRWLHLLRRPVWDTQEGRVVRFYGAAQDITERKLAEETQRESDRLRLAFEKEKELGDLKTKLMITISHEFRTPLTVAYTSAELLERYYERMSVEQRATHLHKVETEIKKLIGMLEDISLLIHARFEELTLTLEPIDFQELCETALLKLDDFESARQRITVNIHEKLPSFVLDARRIQYILTNLLSNALKYSKQEAKIALDVFEYNEGVMIQVTDRGIGIPPEDQVRLFEPFYRANNVGAIGGSGLGLSIVKEIVEMHKGTISLKSEVNQGTQVAIFLPGR